MPSHLSRSRIAANKIEALNHSIEKTIIYLDRNNTPDIWADIKKTITGFHAG